MTLGQALDGPLTAAEPLNRAAQALAWWWDNERPATRVPCAAFTAAMAERMIAGEVVPDRDQAVTITDLTSCFILPDYWGMAPVPGGWDAQPPFVLPWEPRGGPLLARDAHRPATPAPVAARADAGAVCGSPRNIASTCGSPRNIASTGSFDTPSVPSGGDIDGVAGAGLPNQPVPAPFPAVDGVTAGLAREDGGAYRVTLIAADLARSMSRGAAMTLGRELIAMALLADAPGSAMPDDAAIAAALFRRPPPGAAA